MATLEGIWKFIISPITVKTAIRYGFLFIAIVFSIRAIFPLLKMLAPLSDQDLHGHAHIVHFLLALFFALIAGTLTFELAFWVYNKRQEVAGKRLLKQERERKREFSQSELRRVQDEFIDRFKMAFPSLDQGYKLVLRELSRGNKKYPYNSSSVHYLERQGWIHSVAELPHSYHLYRLDDNIREALNEIK